MIVINVLFYSYVGRPDLIIGAEGRWGSESHPNTGKVQGSIILDQHFFREDRQELHPALSPKGIEGFLAGSRVDSGWHFSKHGDAWLPPANSAVVVPQDSSDVELGSHGSDIRAYKYKRDRLGTISSEELARDSWELDGGVLSWLSSPVSSVSSISNTPTREELHLAETLRGQGKTYYTRFFPTTTAMKLWVVTPLGETELSVITTGTPSPSQALLWAPLGEITLGAELPPDGILKAGYSRSCLLYYLPQAVPALRPLPLPESLHETVYVALSQQDPTPHRIELILSDPHTAEATVTRLDGTPMSDVLLELSDGRRAITDAFGVARWALRLPQDIAEYGQVLTSWSSGSGTTTMNTRMNTTRPYLYLVQKEDSVLGIPSSSLLGFYEDYLTEQGITNLPKLDYSVAGAVDDSWISGVLSEQVRAEVMRRWSQGMLTPTVSDDPAVGQRLLASVSGAFIGSDGSAPSLGPLFPVSNSGGTLSYNTEIPTPGPSTAYKAAILVEPVQMNIFASAGRIRSNTLAVTLTPEPGLVDLVDAASNILRPSNQMGDGSPTVTVPSSGELALGFRVGDSPANVLNALTFLALEPLI